MSRGGGVRLAHDSESVNDLADSGGLFAEGAQFSMGLAVIGMTVFVVLFVVIVFNVAFVDVRRSSAGVVFVGGLLNVCENGFLEAARKSHPHAVGVFCGSPMVKVAPKFVKVVVNVVM